MKIRTIPATKLAFLYTALVAALLFTDRASAISIREAYELSLARSRYIDGATYVNHFIGMGLRSDERANRFYFRPNNLTPHAVPTDPMNAWNAGGRSVEAITVPNPGGIGTRGVPDGGATVMLLGAALGALGVARRYLKR
jgi:hypothetical protein